MLTAAKYVLEVTNEISHRFGGFERLEAKRVSVVKDHLFEAKRLRFRFFRFADVVVASLRLNLKKFKEPIFRYYVNWNKGPKAGFRYQLYSWKDWALYGRLEYRWKKGWGGAIESEYFPEDKLTTFVTRNYVGTDRLFNAVDAEFRYRVQGAYHSESQSGRQDDGDLDKYSDVRMPGDFRSEDFEVNTAMTTLFYVHHAERDILTYVKARPRVNVFESIKQDLPTLYAITRPIEIRNTGICRLTLMKASYLNSNIRINWWGRCKISIRRALKFTRCFKGLCTGGQSL